ncbi:MAG: BspA family leucine-rich repeat surface protein [Candidatus Nanoarchaeia archaeon]|nr:BspA family leucine-rich repeat surface protein [Candidatus Nanoarchaeia archaeon]
MKKSVSPLIATVLLIAFTVAIGSVVMNWGTSYIKEEQVKATSTSDVRLTCATNVNLKLMKINNLQDYCYTNDSENVTISVRLTKGTEVLKGIRVNMISNSTSETHDYSQYVEDLNFNLKLTGFSTNVINENDLIEYVELVPYIDNNGESYFCSGSSLAITYLYPCGFEIDSPVIPSNPQEPENPENPENPEEPADPEEPQNPEVPEYEDYYFVSVWNTSLVGTGSSASNQIKLPLASNGNYSFTADWGDGTQSYITTWNQEDVTHTYNQEGQYEIKINGTIVGFSFNNNGDKLKIKDIKQWGDLRLGNNGRYFYGTLNLNITATDVLNLAGTTTLNQMFYNSKISNISRINDWDVSSVINMGEMFRSASNFNEPLDSWDVSEVTNMYYMFNGASSFNQPLNSWNVRNVINVGAMFSYASSFNQPLDSWNLSSVTSLGSMFFYASSFNQPLNSWNVSNITNMIQMFSAASSFNQPLNNWDVSKVTNMGNMFSSASSFNQPLDSWNVSNVVSMSQMFSYASSFNQSLDSWNVSNVTDMHAMFYGSSFNQNISNWCVTNITTEPSLFSSSSLLSSYKPKWGTCPMNLENGYNENQFVSVWNTSLVETGSSASNQIKLPLESSGTYSFTVDWGDETQSYITSWDQLDVAHTYDQEGEYEIKINGTIIGFTFNNLGDKLKIRDIKQWGDLRLGNSGNYFYGTSNLNITATDVLNLSGTTNLIQMFYDSGVSNVSRIDEWNTSNITSLYRTFYYAGYFNSNINNWDVSNVNSMYATFYRASSFNQPLDKWNTSKVTTTRLMFSWASSFNQSLDSWNVSNVINMEAMFSYAFNFNQPLNSWNVGKVTTMNQMFLSASSFNQPLDRWDVSNVTDIGSMFSSASKFNGSLNDWNIAKITSLSYLFHQASSFNQPLDKWNTSKITNMQRVFSSASFFNQPLNSWDVSKVTDMNAMFSQAYQFNQSLYQWNVSSVTNMNSMFSHAIRFNQNISNWCVENIITEPASFTFGAYIQPDFKPQWGTCPINLENEYNANQFVSVWNTSLV